ncbi:MAG: acyl-CoA carboxylase subunit beta [Phycisphaerales bacterium]|nr:acyl-CoA carboxylase subunit beta [Phycisphaerales bacterium]
MPSSSTSSHALTPLGLATAEYLAEATLIEAGGGASGVKRQHANGRLTARERIANLVDEGAEIFECGLFFARKMYTEYGGAAAAGVVTVIAKVDGRLSMIVANDATVKAGAFFPMTCKKVIRAQMIAERARLPLLYLVDSAGVFLPLQEDIFPDTDDFGRIFRNNAVISAKGIPQIAAIMGNCVAGGGYLPVLCDTILMTEGSGLYLAGPALVKAAIGQEVTSEDLGGAAMHAQIAGTIDFREKDDASCLKRIRSLMQANRSSPAAAIPPIAARAPRRAAEDVYSVFKSESGTQYDAVELLACIVDEGAFDEYRAEFGMSIVCAYARIGGFPCGIVANQKKLTQRKMPGGKVGPSVAANMPAVIYDDSADKSARFIMDCNQKRLPIIFVCDTTGFMVGRDSEQGGIIRSGAKMVNAMANCAVPKITLVVGGSYGAGNYAMCGRAFDPLFTMAWPGAKFAVMGAAQAAGTLLQIDLSAREKRGEQIDEATRKQLHAAVSASYNEQQDIRYAASRGWVDRIIEPHNTRAELILALRVAAQAPFESPAGAVATDAPFRTGVLQT